MKILFMFFALLNVAFFTWQADIFHLRAPVSVTKKIQVDSKVPQLALLGELSKEKLNEPETALEEKPEVQIAKTNPKPLPKSSIGNPVCYALGPFDGMTQAKNISEKLKDLGAYTVERSVATETPMGYWVYLPSYKSWKDAKDKVIKLEKKGLKDMFIVGRGAMKNSVSLGLYKNQEGADDRVKQLKKMGEQPKIQTQYKQLDQYWIDIDVEPGKDQVVTTIEKIAQSLTVLELNSRKCN